LISFSSPYCQEAISKYSLNLNSGNKSYTLKKHYEAIGD